jgi:LysR family transcriptional regulator, transcription activator of glutamate synthase operon
VRSTSPGLLARFQAGYPEVEVHVRGGVVEEFIRFLNRDQLDAAFCLRASPMPAGLQTKRLGTEELVAALPQRHPLAAKGGVRAADLEALALISPGPGSALRDAADNFLGEAARLVRFSLESNDPFLIRGLVSQGFGVALLPRSFAELPGPSLELRPLRPSVRLEVNLVWRRARRLSPAAQAFIAFVLEGAGP